MATQDLIIQRRLAFALACDQLAFAEARYRDMPTADNLRAVLAAESVIRDAATEDRPIDALGKAELAYRDNPSVENLRAVTDAVRETYPRPDPNDYLAARIADLKRTERGYSLDPTAEKLRAVLSAVRALMEIG